MEGPQPFPAWVDEPYHGLKDPRGLRAGVGSSEAKPDPEVTRAIARSMAVLGLLASVEARGASLHRDYGEAEGTFVERALKGVAVRKAPGVFTARFLLNDYHSSDGEDDQSLLEQAMKMHFPATSGGLVKVFVQDRPAAPGRAAWARVVVPAASASCLLDPQDGKPAAEPPERVRKAEASLEKALAGSGEGYSVWESTAEVWIRHYISELGGRDPDSSLQVRIRGKDGEKLWLEQSAQDGDRVGLLVSSGTSVPYAFDRLTGSWEPSDDQEGAFLRGAESALDGWSE